MPPRCTDPIFRGWKGSEIVLQKLASVKAGNVQEAVIEREVDISNSRLRSLDQGQVTFRWRDSRHADRTKWMTLEAVEFIRRFLLHILPPGFVKIRHFGFLANRNRATALDLCRQHLNAAPPADRHATVLTGGPQAINERRYPRRHAGLLRVVEWLSADQLRCCKPVRSPLKLLDSS
jgi:hypothetical protein